MICNNTNLKEKVYSLPIDWKINNLQKFIAEETGCFCEYFHLQARDQLILKLSPFHDLNYLSFISDIIPSTVPAGRRCDSMASLNVIKKSSEIVLLISNQELA